jgi:hypothetical protein
MRQHILVVVALAAGCSDAWGYIKCDNGERFSESKADCVKLVCPEGQIINPEFQHECIDEHRDGGLEDASADGAVDCDGGDAITWYADQDGDGLGDPATTLVACEQPADYVANDDDAFPLCAREVSAECTAGEMQCGATAGARELCVELDGCLDWQPALACSESAAKCFEGECTQCTVDADCERFGKVCDGGACVQCTPAREGELCQDPNPGDALAAPACDPTTRTCTGHPRGSVSGCGECSSDSECAQDAQSRCVPTNFAGDFHGNFCLQVAPVGLCPNGAPSKQQATSVLGVASEYCFPRERTTCEAILDFGDGCSSDEECGAPDLSDGKCVGPDGAKRCTFACVGDSDCEGVSCIGPVGAKYCDPN